MTAPPIFLGPVEVTFFVPDVSAAASWYQEIFGAPHFKSEHFYTFKGPGIDVGIHTEDAKAEGPGGRQVLYWRVSNLTQAISAMTAMGCHLYRAPIHGIDGPAVCQLEDPFGNVWGLWQE